MVVDILIAAYLAASIALGIKFGFFRRLVQMVAFGLGLVLARGMSTAASQNFGFSQGRYPVAAHFAIYLGIVVFILVVIELLMVFYNRPLQFFNAILFDRVLGAASALVLGSMQLSVILYLFVYAYSTQGPAGTGQPEIMGSFNTAIGQSLLAKPLRGIESPTLTVIRPLLPNEPGKFFASAFS